MTATEQLADWLAAGEAAVAFTGAGISTESGIPDFRSPGGVWATSRPVYFADYVQSASARQESWRQRSITHAEFVRARPNDGHLVLAEWQAAGRLSGLVTQNIDGLHQAAGSRDVIELHGTARDVHCLECGWRSPADPWMARFLETQAVPDCPECGGIVKHATISFGQPLDQDVLARALALTEQAAVYLAIGSSLVVQPAAALPERARERGARLAIINRDPTPLDGIADLVVREPIGRTLRSVAELLAARG